MSRIDMARALAGWAGAVLVTMAAPPAAAFGGGGYLGECASFATCTAALASGTAAFAQYRFSAVTHFYLLPPNMSPVVNGVSLTTVQDINIETSGATSTAAVGGLCINCLGHPFLSSAGGRAASSFGVNRARSSSSFGAAGDDDKGGGTSATVRVTTGAQSNSAWRDVWTFAGDGHLSATIKFDGVSSELLSSGLFPNTYVHSGVGTSGGWYFDLMVWDVDHLAISEYFEESPGPTLVAQVKDRSGSNNEQRPQFASSLALDFDFSSGVHYVVTAVLGVEARNGREIDLYNTARLQDMALSNGAQMNALSGHDYLAPVPEPRAALQLLAGLAALVCLRSRRQQRGAASTS